MARRWQKQCLISSDSATDDFNIIHRRYGHQRTNVHKNNTCITSFSVISYLLARRAMALMTVLRGGAFLLEGSRSPSEPSTVHRCCRTQSGLGASATDRPDPPPPALLIGALGGAVRTLLPGDARRGRVVTLTAEVCRVSTLRRANVRPRLLSTAGRRIEHTAKGRIRRDSQIPANRHVDTAIDWRVY